jgi:hypothetical protein
MNNKKDAVPGDQAVERLQEAIEQLQKDVVRVEVWAAALTGFSKPVPDYQPNDDFMLKSPKDDGAASSKKV